MADPRDATATDELQHLNSLLFDRDGLRFCGCGNPDDAYALVRDLLSLAPFYDHRKEVQARIGGGPGVEDMVLYALDGAGLTEHGTGIGGSWLIPKGRHYLALMRRYEYEDIDDDETGLPHDGEPCETVKCLHWRAAHDAR
jgi:hypothetical protein